MYKNFKLTDDERKEIMESHKAHGYKKPINELGDDEIGIVRGKPNFKRKTGRPSGDYAVDRLAANQFQQDFESEFPDPGVEYPPYWEKDQAMPSADSEIDTLIKGDYRVGNIWDISAKDKDYGKPDPNEKPKEYEPLKLSKKEELEALEKKILALKLYKQEFGLDAKMTNLYYELYAKYKEDFRDFHRGGVK